MTRRPDWFLVGIVLAVLLAVLLPEHGAKGSPLQPELVNKAGVAGIFFLHGLSLPLKALAAGSRNLGLHAFVQAFTFVLFPIWGAALFYLLEPHVTLELRTGIFFLCALPSTVSSSVSLTAAASGNVPAALFNATLSSLLGVILTPLWLSLVLHTGGQPLPFGSVVLDLFLWLILPLIVGQVMRPWLGELAGRHRAQIMVVDRGIILLLVYTSFCDSIQSGIWRSSGHSMTIALASSVGLLSVALVLTWSCGRFLHFERPDLIAAVFCGSKKTLASGVPMATLIFGADPALAMILLPVMIYHPLQLLVGGWLAGRFARVRSSSLSLS